MSKQPLSNDSTKEVIRSIIQPINKQETMEILRVSVYDVDMYTHFRNISIIMKEFKRIEIGLQNILIQLEEQANIYQNY